METLLSSLGSHSDLGLWFVPFHRERLEWLHLEVEASVPGWQVVSNPSCRLYAWSDPVGSDRWLLHHQDHRLIPLLPSPRRNSPKTLWFSALSLLIAEEVTFTDQFWQGISLTFGWKRKSIDCVHRSSPSITSTSSSLPPLEGFVHHTSSWQGGAQ